MPKANRLRAGIASGRIAGDDPTGVDQVAPDPPSKAPSRRLADGYAIGRAAIVRLTLASQVVPDMQQLISAPVPWLLGAGQAVH